MRIQHNITAMNSYRNYTTNNSALGKNLEKLSSGYKVNRAGDDAAGLAISEKMRAQITGLEGATKNAKDGISLIQTAEGALTEVHSMLNRMTTLAEQSANGTYDNDVDRAQLQKEIESLKSEIDRIADSSNFNGLKLLDGSLASTGGGKAGTQTAVLEMADIMAAGNEGGKALEMTAAVAYTAKVTAAGVEVADSTSNTFTINYHDADGTAKTLSITINGGASGSDTGNITYSINGGDLKKSDLVYADGKASKSDVATIIKNALQEAIGDDFEVTTDKADLKVAAKTPGATKFEINSVTNQVSTAASPTFAVVAAKSGADAYKTLNTANMKIWGANEDTQTTSDANQVVFTVDGKKFAFVNAGEMTAAGKALGNDVTLIEVGKANTAPSATAVANMIKAINSKLGYEGAVAGGADTSIDFKPTIMAGGQGTGGLVLQIGDTADYYNKMTVSVRDMHTSSLGISGIDISNQEGASIAMQKIKDAINLVSDTRGGLGALQNRLDHTINNLGVMRENIQNAESTIRDTDVAEEMMAYTKNSILNQSAQAMLAQANQLPQGVLQLLQ